VVAGNELLQNATSGISIGFGTSADETLRRAYDSYKRECDARSNGALSPGKVELARQYDVPGMNRVATICHWGRSGSLLLASYLDHHPDIVMLPYSASESIYNFFAEYESLSLWEKLVAYPTYSALKKSSEGDFFLENNPCGEFAIKAADYYEAVDALFEVYGNEPSSLATRPRFFQFVHAAYAIAIRRTPGNPRPLMIHAQHYMSEEMAARLVEDFGSAQFIHTVRDPITGVDSWFDRKLDMELYGCSNRLELKARHLDIAVATMLDLMAWDGPHRDMKERTRAIRFEDMHVVPEATMRKLAEWLGIPYHSCLLDSTWNGAPYVVLVRGVPSCGPNPANAKRRSRNLSLIDRLMVFALLHDNFVAWNYPSPRAMHRRSIRIFIVVLFWLVPMKMEWVTARLALWRQALPSLRCGRVWFALSAPFFQLARWGRMRLMIAQEAPRRLAGTRTVLKLV
jgi:Sulfotransferase family